MSRPILLLSALVCLLVACTDGGEAERGSGHLESRAFHVEEFTRIEASRALRVEVEVDPGASEPTVVVTLDGNLFEFLTVYTSGSSLILDATRGLSPSSDSVVTIVTSALDRLDARDAAGIHVTGRMEGDRVRLEASGASRLHVGEVRATTLDLRASGASRITAGSGTVETLDASAAGASSLDLVGVEVAGRVDIDLSGASHAEVTAGGSVRGRASGASILTIEGDPDEVDVESSGASIVRTR